METLPDYDNAHTFQRMWGDPTEAEHALALGEESAINTMKHVMALICDCLSIHGYETPKHDLDAIAERIKETVIDTKLCQLRSAVANERAPREYEKD